MAAVSHPPISQARISGSADHLPGVQPEKNRAGVLPVRVSHHRGTPHTSPKEWTLSSYPQAMQRLLGARGSLQSQRRQQRITAYLFVLPAILFFFGQRLATVAFAFFLSFTNWDILSPAKKLIGFQNYAKIFSDEVFLVTLKNTAYYSLLIVAFGIPTALLLAVIADGLVRRVKTGVRFAFFIPLVTSTVAVTIIWAWIYQPVYGLLNPYLSLLGFRNQAWLLDSQQVIPCLAVMSIWKGVGYNMIIFAAGLQSIDPVYHEVAMIDGASSWKRFWYITLPLLQPTSLVVFITTIIGSFQVFTQIYMMTNGGPGYASYMIGLYIYRTGFMNLKMGRASAMAMVLFAIILVLTLVQLRVGRDRVEY
jgi:ABC-type sugar transport system permease subunit